MSKDNLLERLRNLSTIGKEPKFYEKDSPEENYSLGKIVDEVSILSEHDQDYKFFIQKVKYEKGIFFRFCYYAINKKRTGLVFGQYAPTLVEEEFRKLMSIAKEKGFF